MALVQKWYQVEGATPSSNWPSNPNDNILDDGEITSKISVSAPPGTIVQLNDKRILIGPSGIYDFSYEGIEITEISFPAASDDSQEKALLKTKLNKIAILLSNIAAEIDDQNPSEADYTNGCLDIQNLLSMPISGTDNDTVEEVITDWLAVGSTLAGNQSLKNIIVNYIK